MKVQVNVSDELVKKIDEYAKIMGISRSALCAVWIGQGALGYEKTFDIFQSTLGASLSKLTADEKTKPERDSKIAYRCIT